MTTTNAAGDKKLSPMNIQPDLYDYLIETAQAQGKYQNTIVNQALKLHQLASESTIDPKKLKQLLNQIRGEIS